MIGCVKRKRSSRSLAKDLYISDLFVKTRQYVEANYDRWFIISALYFLVDPETVINPYDETLNDKTVEERRQWSKTVFKQIKQKLPDPSSIVIYFHAGKQYREFLIPLLDEAGYSIKVPLEGLGIGKQLAWYKRHLE